MRDSGADLTLAGFVSAAVASVALVGAIYWLSLQQTGANQWISHTHQVLATIATTRADLADIENGQRGYVLSGRPDDLRPYETGRNAIAGDAQQLRDLTLDNPAQQRSLAEFEAALGPRLAEAAAAVDARRARPPGGGAGRTGPGQHAQALADVLQRMSMEESRLLSGRLRQQQDRLTAFWVAIGLLLAVLLATLSVLYLQQRRRLHAEHQLLDSERRFRLMTDAVADYAILMLDPAGLVQTWNAGARQIKGYEAHEIVGRHFSLFYTAEDREAGRPSLGLAKADAEGHGEQEGWRVRKDGTRFWADVVIAALKDPQGRTTGYCKITRDLTESRKAQEVERSRELSARLIAAQEEERRHVARELHDETGQSLTLIRMSLQDLARMEGRPHEVARECIGHVEAAIAHIRGLSLRLRPPMLDDLGLEDALAWVLEQQARAAGWQHAIELPELQDRMPQHVETACFRIAQEALTNAARYAGATEVRVRLRVVGGRLELEIRDDGRGFDVGRYQSREERMRHFGLVSMRERAAMVGGHLEIDSVPGRGTCVRASFPLPDAQQAGHEDVAIAG